MRETIFKGEASTHILHAIFFKIIETKQACLNHFILRTHENGTYNFCVTPFIHVISNRYHAFLSKFEWGPKTAQIIPSPFLTELLLNFLNSFAEMHSNN